MDKYKIQEKIGTGVLAEVYKVSEKSTNKILVSKEVECQDLTCAENALEEFRVFHFINNRFVCKLRDSYIKWDKKLSSAFVCYLMDYFEKGDLMNHLNKLRSKNEKVPFSSVQSWCGNIIEGMNYLHQNEIVHRNFKPSSLYLQPSSNGSMQLLVGDYGVLTIMKDARTKTKILPGAFDYVAPEIIDAQSFDYRSDIWTIGTVLLDVCTTSLYDHKKFHSYLLNIRHDDDLLQTVLNDIHKVYESKPLVELLEQLLNKNAEKRPAMKNIINNEFVQSCLQVIGSKLIQYKDRSRENNPFSNKLSSEKSIEKIISFLKENSDDEFAAEAGIVKLSELIQNEDDFDLYDQSNQIMLHKLMSDHSNNARIQLAVLKIIHVSLIKIVREKIAKIKPNEKYISSPLVERFFYIFLKYNQYSEIALVSVQILDELSNFANISNQLAKFDVTKHLLVLLQTFAKDPKFCAQVCKSFWSLCVHESIMKSLANKKPVKFIREVLINHQKDEFCVEMACNSVIALSTNERLLAQEEIDVDVTSAILQALQHHLHSASVIKSACLAFSSLIGCFEESAFRFLYLPSNNSSESGIDGIELMKAAYEIHKDRSEIVEHICSVFKELCNYDEMVIEMKSLKLNETFINEIGKRFRDNIEISRLCSIVESTIDSRFKNEQLTTAVI